MSQQRFITHAKRADAAYQQFAHWQREVDRMEEEAMRARGGQDWSAMIDIKDRPQYKIALANRNAWRDRASLEAGMAQLHRGMEW